MVKCRINAFYIAMTDLGLDAKLLISVRMCKKMCTFAFKSYYVDNN